MKQKLYAGSLLILLVILFGVVLPSMAYGNPHPPTPLPQQATPMPSIVANPLGGAEVCPHGADNGGPAGSIRIADTGNNRVQTIVPRDNAFADVAGSLGNGDLQFNQPQGIVTGPWNRTYVADTGNNRVQILAWNLAYIDQFGGAGSGDGKFNNPTGIALSHNERIYVVDTGNGRIQYFDRDGAFMGKWGSSGSGNGQFNNALGIAVSWTNSSAYVADTGNNRIQRFSSGGIYLSQWGSSGSGNGQFSSPSAIAVHPLTGDVYVVDTGNNRIQRFNSDGQFIQAWGTLGSASGSFNAPSGIAISPRYGVFVMDKGNNRVQQFTDGGAFINQWGTGGNQTGEFSNATAVSSNMRGVVLDKCYVHDFVLNGQNRRATVYYTTDNGLMNNRVPEDPNVNANGYNKYARSVGVWTETSWRAFDSYNLGEPRFVHTNVDLGGGVMGNEMEVFIYDIGAVGAAGRCCGPFNYEMNANHVRDAVNANDDRKSGQTVIHEVFHSVQPSAYYGSPGEPRWSVEGGSRNAQDKVVTDIDDWYGSGYRSQVNTFMDETHRTDFRELAYAGGLFWTYFQEQLGDNTYPEPGYGMSAIEAYFDIVSTTSNRGLDAVAKAVRDLENNPRSLEEFWTDFTIANYVQRLEDVAPEHDYVDAESISYNYSAAEKIFATNSTNSWGNTLQPYSAYYYRVLPFSSGCHYIALDFLSNRRVGFSVANHNDGALLYYPDTFIGSRAALTVHLQGSYNDTSRADGIGVILTGLAETAVTFLEATCIDPTMELVMPTAVQPGYAGLYDDPGTVVLYLSVSDGGYGPVRGLEGNQFEVSIGGEPATLFDTAELEDFYVLVLQAPEQTAVGDYDLVVTLDNTLTITETGAIRYTSDINDNMLVIDRSGSMADYNKLYNAQLAAQLQITDMDSNAWAGLASFNSTVTLDFGLTDITVEPARTDLRTAVNDLTDGGGTFIVGGVNIALNELESNGGTDHTCNVTLLSDGIDNISSAAGRQNLLNRLRNSVCPVYAIALGPDADKLFLQELVDASAGQLYIATLPPPPLTTQLDPDSPQAITASGYVDASWENRLAGFYDDIAARQAGRERIFVGADTTTGSQTEIITIDSSVSEAVFSVQNHVLNLSTNSVQMPVSSLRDPNGVLVDGSYPGAIIQSVWPHDTYRITNPIPGDWEVFVFVQLNLGHLVAVSGDTIIGLDMFARAPEDVPGMGRRVPIVAVFHDDQQTLPGAEVTVDVQADDGTVTHLPLFDDGQHNDGEADDGIYGNWFTRGTAVTCHTDPEMGTITVCDNAFQVYGVATINDIRREAQTGFVIEAAPDTDGDMLPDDWEEAHGLDPNDPSDANEDPDHDDATNLEEYNNGTDPNNPDSDGGGENDGSEIAGGLNPFDPTDDRIGIFYEINVIPLDGQIVLYFPPNPGLSGYQIYRRLWPLQGAGTWTIIATVPPITGVYTDTTVLNGQGYEYQIIPIFTGGVVGVPVTSVPVIPAVDVEPPEGWIAINNGALSTSQKQVTLQIGFESDVVAMRLSNGPNLSGVVWESAVHERDWTLADDLQNGETGFVYVEFMDAAGNMSGDTILNSASILYESGVIYLPFINR